MSTEPELSVIVPVYGCNACLPALHSRLSTVLASSTSSYEIVFVDDRSPDGSWAVVKEIARRDPRVRALLLSRNFGQHAAITAGLQHCRGRWAVVMDCDLQDPPEEIPRFLAAAKSGYDVVYGRRIQKKHSAFRRLAARAFFRIVNFFNKSHLQGDYGSFSLISRKVVSEFRRINDQDRHYLFILNWLGFRSTEVHYQHGQRLEGRSSYSFRALMRHAFNGIFFQTTILLRWIVYAGFWVSALGLLLAAYFVYQYLAHSVVPGWTSLAVLILLIGGFIIASTGISGLYVGKIFEQAKNRPLYVIDESIGGDDRT
jgi:dolichol-phosphate mannosyltransferase